MLLYQILASTRHEEIQETSYKNSKLNISTPKWNDELTTWKIFCIRYSRLI